MPRLGTLLALVAILAGCTHSPAPLGDAPTSDPAPDLSPLDRGLAVLDTVELRAHVAELASDAYEGRGTGTPGETRTVEYVIRTMREAGLVGGMPDGSFTQPVPLRSIRTTRAEGLGFVPEAGETIALTYGPDLIGTPDDTRETLRLDSAPMMFVGYGITNPGYDWDDYEDVDVSGKVLVGFVNDPPATASEPTLFQADTLTYNGRWTYKYEEARRRGALAMLLIHTTETAGYPFSVLNSDAYGERYTGVAPPEGALALAGWMSEDAARRLAEASRMSLESWFRLAGSRAFEPVDLPVTFSTDMTFAHEAGVTGTNVVGKLPGQTEEAIVYTAHHDHLGIDREAEARGEDGIYNGAIDNASGVAMVLEIAQAFGAMPEPPRRTVYFVTLSAEESGLLGSSLFADDPPVPLRDMIANLNLDGANLYGETDDVVGIGAERSELFGLLEDAAEAEGMTVTMDPTPGQGLFFRSDQLPFARGGVPAVFLIPGVRYRDRPSDYAAQVRARYRAEIYHQPTDELTPDLAFDGLLQQARVAFRLGHRLATSDLRPEWRPSEAFADTRRQSESR
ncbi:MAG: M28 family peptidase [Bacteroidota bacterium]